MTWVAKCGIECLLADIGGSFLQRALLNRTEPKASGPHSYVCNKQGGGYNEHGMELTKHDKTYVQLILVMSQR